MPCRSNEARAVSKRGHGEICHWCKRPLEATGSHSTLAATKDHVHPKSLGGRVKVWCCVACNNLKGDMLPCEWEAFMATNPEWWKLRRKPKRRGYKISILDDLNSFYRQHGGVVPPSKQTTGNEIVDKAVALFRKRNQVITPRLAAGHRNLAPRTVVRIHGGEP